MLGDWHGDADDVGLLEGVRSHRGGEDLAGDREQRDRVHVGVRYGGDQVGGAGAAGGDGDADAAGRGGIALGRVAGALFVAHQDVANLGLRHELVVERNDGAAGDAEDVGHAEQLEGANDRAGAGEHLRFRRRGSRGHGSGFRGHGR